jgi:hypothetical protein
MIYPNRDAQPDLAEIWTEIVEDAFEPSSELGPELLPVPDKSARYVLREPEAGDRLR